MGTLVVGLVGFRRVKMYSFPAQKTKQCQLDRLLRTTTEEGADFVASLKAARDSMYTVLATRGIRSEDREEALLAYLPYAHSLVVTVEENPGMRLNGVLRYGWTSILYRKPSKVLEVSNTYMDVTQMLNGLAAARSNRAAELMATTTSEEDFLVNVKVAAKYLREAAGMWEFLCDRYLSRWVNWPTHRPPEVMIPVAQACSLAALAQAQQLTVKKGTIDGVSPSLLGKLLLDVAVKYSTAHDLIRGSSEYDDIDKTFRKFLLANASFHRAMAFKFFAITKYNPEDCAETIGEVATLITVARRKSKRQSTQSSPQNSKTSRPPSSTRSQRSTHSTSSTHAKHGPCTLSLPSNSHSSTSLAPRTSPHPLPLTNPKSCSPSCCRSPCKT